jgi:hypothetical protein
MRMNFRIIIYAILSFFLISCCDGNLFNMGFNPEEYQVKIDKTREEAEFIISALEQYKERYGSHPSSLDSLIPEYFSVVPESSFGEYEYSYSEADDFVLSFTVYKHFRKRYTCASWQHDTLGRIWDCGYHVIE